MTFRPSRGGPTSGHSRRGVVITQADLAAVIVDPLLALKRLVNDFDLLEADDPVDWALRVDAITSDTYKKLFQGGNLDRLRFRNAVYGWDRQQLTVVYNDLDTAFGP